MKSQSKMDILAQIIKIYYMVCDLEIEKEELKSIKNELNKLSEMV